MNSEREAELNRLGFVGLLEKQDAMIDRRERAIAVLAIACVVSTLYILSSSGCFLGRWPIIIKGGGSGGGEGSTVEGDK